jgi:hypothetical protein
LQPGSRFRQSAPTLSALQVELVNSSNPAGTHGPPATFPPRQPPGLRPGPDRAGASAATGQQASAPPARHLWRRRPSPASRPFTPPVSPPRPRGPSPLNWLQPAAATEWGSGGSGRVPGAEGTGRPGGRERGGS